MKNKKERIKVEGGTFLNDFILEETKITGDINSSNDIRIDGIIEGTLNIQGRIVIGETAKIKGNISCQNVDISGEVVGNIEAQQLISIKETANINGDLYSQQISIEQGAKYTGACKVGEKPNQKTTVPNSDNEKKNN